MRTLCVIALCCIWPSLSLADERPTTAPAPVPFDWIVANDDPANSVVVAVRGRETDLGDRNGWKCSIVVRVEAGEDQATVYCRNGKTTVASMTSQKHVGAAIDAAGNVSIASNDGASVQRVLAYGVRPKKT